MRVSMRARSSEHCGNNLLRNLSPTAVLIRGTPRLGVGIFLAQQPCFEFLGARTLQPRTSNGASGRPPNWHAVEDRSNRSESDSEHTLGLDDEIEDIPTAQLEAEPASAVATHVPEVVALTPEFAASLGFVAELPAEVAPSPQSAPATSEAAIESKASISDSLPTQRPALSDPGKVREEPAIDPQLATADPIRAPSASSPTASTPQPSVAALDSEPPKPRTAAEREISPGSLLCNRYLLGRVLGSGGGAYIFQAEDRRRIGAEDFGNRIAIKVLRPEMRRNSHALTRLKREFRQMQRLTHPGIARVFDLACDDGVWFMTMELIEGQTVNHWLKAKGSRAGGLRIISCCCDALAHAHDAGIVHGDLKPSNVLVLPTGGVKLVDFGSAAERAASGEPEKERSFAATPPYASPQVLSGDIADPRDDVFSLACLTYAVLTQGEHPFDRKSSTEAQQAGMRPAYARGLHPREFDVIVRALAWEREHRQANVREFLHALLASDLRRDARDAAAIATEVHSKPESPSVERTRAPAGRDTHQAGPHQARAPFDGPRANGHDDQRAVRREIAAPKVDALAATAAKVDESSQDPSRPKREVIRAEDIARLKAVISAAEEHAERVEHNDRTSGTDKKGARDSHASFSGYVAGPLASQEEASSIELDKAPASTAPSTPPKKAKRLWPWQRTAFFAAFLAVGVSAAIYQRFERAEPVQQGITLPVPDPLPAATETIPPSQLVATPVEPPVAEKKSAQIVATTKAAPTAKAKVSFATRTLQIGAEQTIAALTVNRVNSQRGRAIVGWTIEAGTARPGIDYLIAESPVIEFLDGQRVRSLFIRVIPDQDPQSSRHSKTFTVKLQPTSGGPELGDINKVYVTIVGDVDTSAGTESVSANL